MKAGWQTKRLGDICEIIKGRKPVLKQTPSVGDLPYLIAKVMRGSSEPDYASVNDRNSITVETSETIIICDGSNSGEVFTGFRGIISSTMGKISKQAEIDDNYLRAFLASTFEVFNGAKTGAAIPHLDKEAMFQLEFPFPPLPEQQRIVSILDEVFDGIAAAKANAEKNLQNARALFQAGYIAIFDESVAHGRQRTTVANVTHPSKGSMRTGPFGSQLLHSEFVDEGIAVLGIDNAVNNEFRWDKRRYITEEKYKELSRYRVKPGDVLITIMGTCGRCAIVPDDIQAAINTKHLCCITLDANKCIPGFLHSYFLYHPAAQQFLAAKAKGSIMAGLNMGIISELPIFLPTLTQQHSIADKVGSLRSETHRLESIYQRKLVALEALKKSLLHQAFSGEL